MTERPYDEPAFPVTPVLMGDGRPWQVGSPGMTTLQYAALRSTSTAVLVLTSFDKPLSPAAIAKEAIEIARATLEACEAEAEKVKGGQLDTKKGLRPCWRTVPENGGGPRRESGDLHKRNLLV